MKTEDLYNATQSTTHVAQYFGISSLISCSSFKTVFQKICKGKQAVGMSMLSAVSECRKVRIMESFWLEKTY